MVAFAEIETPEAPSGPLSFGYGAAVAVEDGGAVADGILLASAVCSDEQGRATFTGYVADNETGLLHARARPYSPTLGRFGNRDTMKAGPLPGAGDGYLDGLSLYGAYFVPNAIDPTGNVLGSTTAATGFHIEVVSADHSPCGHMDYRVKFVLSANTPIGGWIIQKVHSTFKITDCSGNVIADTTLNFFESWDIPAGTNTPRQSRDGVNDFFRTSDRGTCTKGKIVIEGQVRFYEGSSDPDSWIPGGVPISGILNSIPDPPGFPRWSQVPMPTQNHTATVEWDCCNGKIQTFTHNP